MALKMTVVGVVILLFAGAGFFLLKSGWNIQRGAPSVISQSLNDSAAIYAPQNAIDLPHAHSAFGFNLIKSLAHQAGNENVFISPAGISLAISMIYAGSSGETQSSIRRTLQFQNLSIDTINRESLNLLYLLIGKPLDIQLNIANSLWLKQGFDFQERFLSMVKNNFQAELQSLDFTDPASVNIINAWVNGKTRSKIPTIVERIPKDTVMFLINAVYFKGSWTDTFDKSLTEERDFTFADGTAQKKSFMQRRADFMYYETDDMQSVSIPYGKSKRFSMYVFLPKDMRAFMNSLTIDYWDSLMGRYTSIEGTVLLPRFKIEYEKELNETLANLGMGVAFVDGADFSGIPSKKSDYLKIDAVKHKTYIDVNEEGTEAAAVTYIGMAQYLSLDTRRTFLMEVNKPFFIAIRDNLTQEILFMGVIQNPTQ